MAVESDEWSATHPSVTSPEIQDKLKAALESVPLIVEHRFYKGAAAPARLVFDEFSDLESYLAANAHPGDSFWFWNYSTLCKDDNALTYAKYPDSQGRAPKRGAY